MFKIEFYDELIRYIFSSWWMYTLLGINFIVLGVLVYLYPEFLSLLIASLFIFCGLIFVAISWGIWSVKHYYKEWKKQHQIIVQ